MTTRVADVVQVQAQASDVESLHDRGVTWVEFKPMPDVACSIDFGLRKFPDFGLLSGTVRGVRHEHARRDSGDGDDDFSFHMNLRGLSLVTGRRGETTLRDGDAMLLSYSVSRTIDRPQLVDHRVIRLSRALLSPLVRNIDDATLRRIPRGTGMLRLLRNYVDAVFEDPALASPQMRRLVAAQLCDLVAVTLGATRDAIAVAEGRGIRAARLRAIKGDIEAHLSASDLSPSAVAKRHQISDSYIRKLFESEGTSFSQFVLGRRLERARRMLTDPGWPQRSIASIAFDAGFGDLSYFNRTFRHFYGLKPSEMRRAMMP
ncbi:AraC family transcriptional regulator [Bradyrhizobium sp. GCM10028915]|uniref:helix-turn-helix transcriptional regulator n=1 Tax=Bradyrhizobium sp. GCM10028915 TaxID=3273385 RepID=UPI00360CF0C9